MAYWFSFAAVAGAFGGLIAFGIQQAHTSISNWRLLFIIEVCSLFYPGMRNANRFSQGIPTVLLGVVCFFFLPDRPESSTYLTKEEKHLSMERMSRGTSADIGATINKSMSRLGDYIHH